MTFIVEYLQYFTVSVLAVTLKQTPFLYKT